MKYVDIYLIIGGKIGHLAYFFFIHLSFIHLIKSIKLRINIEKVLVTLTFILSVVIAL